jgi:hypothetical protein
MKLRQLINHEPDIKTYASTLELVDNTLVGVEVELEEVNQGMLVDAVDLKHFTIKGDGSLRGNAAYEFLFKIPLAGVDVIKALNSLESFVTCTGVPPHIGDRTSLHVHVDVRDGTTDQLVKLVIFYLIFENALYKYAGRTFDRKNNNFCIPLNDLLTPITILTYINNIDAYNDRDQSIYSQEFMRFLQEQNRYAGLNIVSLRKLGSIEFRMHQGAYKASEILRWINILLKLKSYAFAFKAPVSDIPGMVSVMGFNKLLDEVFGEFSRHLYYPKIERDMLDNLRHANPIFLSKDAYGEFSNYCTTIPATNSLMTKVAERQAKLKNLLVKKRIK